MAGWCRWAQSKRAGNSLRVSSFADPGGIRRSLTAFSLVQKASFLLSEAKLMSRVNLVRGFLDVEVAILHQNSFYESWYRSSRIHAKQHETRNLQECTMYSVWYSCTVCSVSHLKSVANRILLLCATPGHAPFYTHHCLNIIVPYC